MRVLLDTSYLYGPMESLGLFTDAERRLLDSRAARNYVGAVSIWEVRLKFQARHGSGVRKSRFDPEDVVAALEQQDVTFLPTTMVHACKSLDVAIPHRDPFDELLLVQAQAEGLRLLTVDRRLVGHPLATMP